MHASQERDSADPAPSDAASGGCWQRCSAWQAWASSAHFATVQTRTRSACAEAAAGTLPAAVQKYASAWKLPALRPSLAKALARLGPSQRARALRVRLSPPHEPGHFFCGREKKARRGRLDTGTPGTRRRVMKVRVHCLRFQPSARGRADAAQEGCLTICPLLSPCARTGLDNQWPKNLSLHVGQDAPAVARRQTEPSFHQGQASLQPGLQAADRACARL